MKKNSSIALLYAMISFAAQAESPCRVALVINGVVQNWSVTNFTVPIFQGDTLICSLATGSPCGTCSVDSAATYWIIGGVTTPLITVALTDSGSYTLYAQSDGGTSCADDYNTFHLTITYTTTAISEMTSADKVGITPTLSSGIFKINDGNHHLERFAITNETGAIVYFKQHPDPEVNLSSLQSGIYFYALTDDKKNVWHGRIVKE